MLQVSVVIITRNEAGNIVTCIESAKRIATDIIVIDTGSTDNTIDLAKKNDARVKAITWVNYGTARNAGASIAVNDWIFALDADERITHNLAANISAIDFGQTSKVYGFRRQNYFGERRLYHGPLGYDKVFRLYHRKNAQWDNVCVHEQLAGNNINFCCLDAVAEHYGNKDPEHYLQKKKEYAALWALKKKEQGRHPGTILRLSSTVISFIKAYFIQLGFLDLKYGFKLAKINAYYTWYKYGLLQNLVKSGEKINPGKSLKIPPLQRNANAEQLI